MVNKIKTTKSTTGYVCLLFCTILFLIGVYFFSINLLAVGGGRADYANYISIFASFCLMLVSLYTYTIHHKAKQHGRRDNLAPKKISDKSTVDAYNVALVLSVLSMGFMASLFHYIDGNIGLIYFVPAYFFSQIISGALLMLYPLHRREITPLNGIVSISGVVLLTLIILGVS